MAGAWVAIMVGAAALLVEPAPDRAVASRSEDAAQRDSSEPQAAPVESVQEPTEPQEEVARAAEAPADPPDQRVDDEAPASDGKAADAVASTEAETLVDDAEPAEDETVKQAEAGTLAARLDSSDAPGPAAADPAAVLSDGDVKLYRDIFAAQKKAKWRTANALIKRLDDKRLVGHVLAERYLRRTGYRSSYKELRSWLAKYADHPQAKKVYKLALKKRPAGSILPREPVTESRPRSKPKSATAGPYRSKKRLTKSQRRRVRQLQARIRRQVGRKQLSLTEKLITGSEVQRLFDDVQIDDATANVAAGWFYHGDYNRAMELAAPAAVRSGEKVPLALWTTGLASWRLKDFSTAALHFEAYALSPEINGQYTAAGAYWAARCHQKLGNEAKVREWLELAAEFPRTFYGMIARYRLGQSMEFDFEARPLDDGRVRALRSTAAGGRALALFQVGETRRLELELRSIGTWDRPDMAEAILALAQAARLPSLSVRVARRLIYHDQGHWTEQGLDWALYPIPPWEPAGGFNIDRALIYAIMRQESQFKRYAKSRSGARGLMQLLPSTASSMTKRRNFRGRGRSALYQTELNIELGQRYLNYLMKSKRIQRDVLRTAIAYNGGPGNLRGWDRRIKSQDRLLFIESLTLRETRMYVEHILTNLWIYRARLGQPAPTLAAIAADDIPVYEPLDGKVYTQVDEWSHGRQVSGLGADGSSPWWQFW